MPSASSFNFLAMSMGGANGVTGACKLQNLTLGTTATSTPANPPVVNGSTFFRFGASYSSAFIGSLDMSFAAVFAAALSDAEVAAVYGQVQRFLSYKYSQAI